MLTAQQIADKWVNNTSNATEAYKNGINAVTESPMQKAANNVDGYVAGVQRAAQSGKYQRGLLRVDLPTWKNLAATKGANRLGTGVAAAKGKMQSFLGEFLPFLSGLQTQLSTMPRGSFEQNKARANAAMDYIHGFRRTG